MGKVPPLRDEHDDKVAGAVGSSGFAAEDKSDFRPLLAGQIQVESQGAEYDNYEDFFSQT